MQRNCFLTEQFLFVLDQPCLNIRSKYNSISFQIEVNQMDEAKTVGGPDDLAIFTEQSRDVQNMRNALLSFDKSDATAASKAIRNVTLLRVYHQVESIVRYTEMIDKLQDRIYQSIDSKLANSDPDDETLCFTLIPLVERLQKNMIESHKLLEPYLSMEQLTTIEVPQQSDPADSFTSMILDQESREKVRTSAQQVLAAISALDNLPDADRQQELTSVQTKAQEAIAALQNNTEENNG